MRRLTVGAAIASLVTVGAAGPAAAKPNGPKPSPRAHVYWANLGPVAFGPYGMVPGTRGTMQLGDGKRNDKVSIHVRGLQPGQTYEWHIHQAAAGVADPCASPAAGGTGVPGWIYRPLTANEAGNANSQGRSFTFNVAPGATYYVDVHMTDGVVACGVVRAKRKRQQPFKPLRGKGHRKPAPIIVTGGGQTAAQASDTDEPFEVDGQQADAGGGATPSGTTAGTGTTTTTGTTAGTGTTADTGTQPAQPCYHDDDQDDQGEDGEDGGNHGPRGRHHGGRGRD